MSALAPVRPRLAQIVPLLGSNHDGEILGAARAIGRVLRSAGLDWHSLAAEVAVDPTERVIIQWRERPAPAPEGPPQWQALGLTARREWIEAVRKAEWLSEWERSFATDMWTYAYCSPHVIISTKQRNALNKLFAKAFAMGVRP